MERRLQNLGEMANRPRQRDRRLIDLVAKAQTSLGAINTQGQLDRRIRRVNITQLNTVNRYPLILITVLRLNSKRRRHLTLNRNHRRIRNFTNRNRRRRINLRRCRRLVVRDFVRKLDITTEVGVRRKRPGCLLYTSDAADEL